MTVYFKFPPILLAITLLGSNVYTQSSTTPIPKVITIAIDEYPPYTSQTLTGYGIDCQIVSEVFKKIGVTVEYEFLPSARALMLTKRGHKDATVPWAMRQERLKDYYYSAPIREADIEHFFYIDSNFVWNTAQQDYSLLNGKNIGAIIGYNYGEKFEKASLSKIIEVDRIAGLNQNFKKLLAGHLDLVISQKRIGDYTLHQFFTPEQQKNIRSTPQNSDPIEYDYLLFSKVKEYNRPLRDKFDTQLKIFMKSDHYKTLLNGKTSTKK
ncbi:MAG: transporter substrate-binding domain-containing protein [Fibrobacterales bacterium]